MKTEQDGVESEDRRPVSWRGRGASRLDRGVRSLNQPTLLPWAGPSVGNLCEEIGRLPFLRERWQDLSWKNSTLPLGKMFWKWRSLRSSSYFGPGLPQGQLRPSDCSTEHLCALTHSHPCHIRVCCAQGNQFENLNVERRLGGGHVSSRGGVSRGARPTRF